MTASMVLSCCRGSVLAVALAVLYRYLIRRLGSGRQSKKAAAKHVLDNSADKGAAPKKDLRRKASMAHGGAVDHEGCAAMVPDPDFDLDQTVFKKIQGPIARRIAARRLCLVAHWTDAAVERILAQFSQVPPPAPLDRSITDFMLTECKFMAEHHADGSFMDHLGFCHDYCAVHFSTVSPRVMLLHSIMGVATNMFPMDASKIPKLAALLTPEEMKHVQSFPSVLRLLAQHSLLDDLESMGADIHRLRGASFRRVLDNERLDLEAEDLWVQLNYQLVHLVDFVPVADWSGGSSHPLFQVFLRLYMLLSRAGQLRAKVALHKAQGGQLTAADVETCSHACVDGAWNSFVRYNLKRTVAKFSLDAGHSLEYKLTCS